MERNVSQVNTLLLKPRKYWVIPWKKNQPLACRMGGVCTAKFKILF